MDLTPILLDWSALALRWLHLIAGIAWIGSSFYFMALDASLKKRAGLPEGVSGETWQVHGGGFYRMWKYSVAPPEMPAELTWFKWEAYVTLMSGLALLVVVYYLGAELYMIDPAKADIGPWTAALVGIVVLALGWVVYDRLCKSPLGKDQRTLAGIGLAAFPLVCLALDQVVTGRAAFLHVGALIGTIMVANVAMVIIPNQKKVVAAHAAPDPALGAQAKQRSVHNNYLTLPVLFIMISNHYPQTFASPFNWLILALVLVIGASIRHYFNIMHAGTKPPWWPWAVAALGFIVAIWIASFPATPPPLVDTAADERPATLAAVEEIVQGRCIMCHGQETHWPGWPTPPRASCSRARATCASTPPPSATEVYQTHAMPPGNISLIEDGERRLIARWVDARAPAE
ncbi:MAG: urate hydroxylase PuuD [Geminicoccaceae bacterium]